ncbi:MAG: Hsp20/alpha crystallin family protein [Candidatus Jordarchaeaceae archaeon]
MVRDKDPTEIEPFRRRADIFRSFEEIFDDFTRSFEAFMKPWELILPSKRLREFGPEMRYPRIDLEDNGDSYTVTAELPGLSKDQVDIKMTKDSLEISGEAKEEKEEKDKNYIHRERTYASFRRRIAFPEEVIPEKAEADMKKGILTVKVPKKEPTPAEKPVKIEIKEE